jgi:hypothetical protein
MGEGGSGKINSLRERRAPPRERPKALRRRRKGRHEGPETAGMVTGGSLAALPALEPSGRIVLRTELKGGRKAVRV